MIEIANGIGVEVGGSGVAVGGTGVALANMDGMFGAPPEQAVSASKINKSVRFTELTFALWVGTFHIVNIAVIIPDALIL